MNSTFELPYGNPIRGALIFKKYCASCHTLIQTVHRNDLNDFFEKKIQRHHKNHTYTPRVTQSYNTWDPSILMKYLESPQCYTYNRNTKIKGVKSEQDRLDIIHFLSEWCLR